ncbi:hypothetical protein [Amycolatopsis anabasis]|uniref:hypothetical protein n=1 Tax=Amycolatopsis anabasis TaxID=1840409 RepID=UPI00131AC9F8|nr:hypothetical protein [Amycolatopsis anabasis]
MWNRTVWAWLDAAAHTAAERALIDDLCTLVQAAGGMDPAPDKAGPGDSPDTVYMAAGVFARALMAHRFPVIPAPGVDGAAHALAEQIVDAHGAGRPGQARALLATATPALRAGALLSLATALYEGIRNDSAVFAE